MVGNHPHGHIGLMRPTVRTSTEPLDGTNDPREEVGVEIVELSLTHCGNTFKPHASIYTWLG